MIGVPHDRAFEALEANLDWLETTGVFVERFDLDDERCWAVREAFHSARREIKQERRPT